MSRPSGPLLPRGFAALKPKFGEVLARERRDGYGKQQELADAVGISRESLSRIEGGRAVPRPETLQRLLDELSLDWSAVAYLGVATRPERHFDGTFRGDLRRERGAALRAGRRAAGLTLAEVADRVGISPAQLSRIERGEGERSKVYQDHPDDGREEPRHRRQCFRCEVLASLEAKGRERAGLPALRG